MEEITMKHSYAPYMKHYGKTSEEQLEKNKPLMEWLKQQLEEEVSEEEAKANTEYWERVKEIIDSNRPTGAKLFSKEV
jgi:hypothetical protein